MQHNVRYGGWVLLREHAQRGDEAVELGTYVVGSSLRSLVSGLLEIGDDLASGSRVCDTLDRHSRARRERTRLR
jgi:hypothetical protein